MRRTVVVLLTAAALLAGCGGSGGGGGLPSTEGRSDIQQIRDMGAWFAKAAKARDGEKMCKALTPSARAQLVFASAFTGTKPGPCEEMVVALFDSQPADEVNESGEYTDVQLSGSAHAKATKPNGEVDTLVKTAGGHWLYDASEDDEEDTTSDDTTTDSSTTAAPRTGDLPELTKDGTVGYRMTVANDEEADAVCAQMQEDWPEPDADGISLFSPEGSNLQLCVAP